MREIVLREAKPALEWIGGRAVQKVSPVDTFFSELDDN